ncbi:Rv2253 family sensor-like surface protein [Mycolicibacterium mengxianglii]|uniref:hypothetical protein n=1 Tax=Mycolicibacterium mengxianglii TaxID=2736649 RepID=UPI00355843A5
MAVRRLRASACVAATVTGMLFAMCAALGTAHAAGQPWSGRYTVVTYASQKAGTSIAARQSEADFSAQYTFATSCSSRCVATASDGPAPSNPTIPQPTRYLWDGSQWALTYEWQWECYRGDGVPRLFSPAQSWVFYSPQPDGSLQGTWHTDILSGDCRGNVLMPVAAYPVR